MTTPTPKRGTQPSPCPAGPPRRLSVPAGSVAFHGGHRDRRAAGAGPRALVTCIPFGTGAWALALLQGGAQAQARQLTLDLTAGLEPGTTAGAGACAVVRVPSGLMDPGLGPAVLHHARGKTAAYCAGDQIAQEAADMLAAFVSRAADVLGHSGPACGGPTVRVVRLGDGEFGALRPAVAVARGGRLTVFVCAGLITAGLADALGTLWQGLCQVPDAPRRGLPAAGGTWLLPQ